jgi:hypothetical protein
LVDWAASRSLLTDINRFPEFCSRFLKIRPIGGGVVPLVLNKIQLYVFNLFVVPAYLAGEPVRILLLKARQFGGSTLFTAFNYWLTLGHESWSALVVGTDKPQALELFKMLRAMNNAMPWTQSPPDLSTFPYFLQSGDRVSGVEFNRKSRVHQSKMVNELERMQLQESDMVILSSSMEVKSAEIGDKLGRAGTYQSVLASEVAKWKSVTYPLSALMSCCHPAPETLLVLESTADGLNEFYHLWENMRFNDEDVPSFWQKCFIPWFWDKKYELDVGVKREFVDDYEEDLAVRIQDDTNLKEHIETLTEDRIWHKIFWRRQTIRDVKAGDIDLFNEDYPSTPAEAFISSGQGVFNKGALRKMAAGVKSPIWRGHVFAARHPQESTTVDEHIRGSLRIWQEPEPDHMYIIFADVAEGKALEGVMADENKSKYDYSSAQVLCATSYPPAMKQVALWHGNCDPDKFGDVLVALAKKYNNAYLAWEINNQGRGLGFHIINKHGYSHIYMRKNYDHVGHITKPSPGWRTDSRTKPDMVVISKRVIRDLEVEIFDEGTVIELRNYVQDGNTYKPASGHDDRVDSLMGALAISDSMLAYWRREHEAKKRETDRLKGTPQEHEDFEYEEDDAFNPYLGDDF